MARLKQKLLRKSLRPFLLFSFLLLLLATPIFYFSLQELYRHETDEILEIDLEEFIKITAPILKQEDIANWNRFNPNVQLTQSDKNIKNHFFTKIIYNPLADEDEPFRLLQTNVSIDGQNYLFVDRQNLVENKDLFVWVILLFVFLFAAFIVGLYFINRRLTKHLWQPFNDTLEQIESFNINEQNALNVNDNGIEEFARLNHTIAKWLNRNADIYNTQKEFIENAAHELQTPLAVFKAKVENLMQLENNNEAQYKLLNELNLASDKLSKLNKNLLLYARVDNQQYSVKEGVSILNLINDRIDFYKEQAAVKLVDIVLSEETKITLPANPFMVETLLNNLIMNSIRHNVENGKIEIAIKENELIISNSGPDKPLLESDLYKRFSNNQSLTKGTGLGLAIVKRIVDFNNWKINYQFLKGLHTFSVHFS